MSLRLALVAIGTALMLWLGMHGPVRAASASAGTQPLASLRAAAEQGLRDHFARPGSRIEVSTEPLDLRLQLAVCTQPLRALISDQTQVRPRMMVRS